MLIYQPAKLLRLHFSEGDHYKGKPLYEAIVQKCRDLKMAGITVFRGLEGYGDTAAMHRHHLLTRDQPILVTIVDQEENIQRLLSVAEEMMDTGLIAISDVQIRRVQKSHESRDVQKYPDRA